MKVFVAGSTGAVGKFLVPQLIENGHEVVALVRTSEKAKTVAVMGAKAALADALNQDELTAAIRSAEPEAIFTNSLLSRVSATSRNWMKNLR
jgi:uncharacterized protein YbjT (DUF2867 family)